MWESGWAVRQTSDGGYIVTGTTESVGAGYVDLWLVKTGPSGDSLWTKAYGGVDAERGYDVIEMPDGGFLAAGHTNTFGAGDYDLWLVRTDSTGDSLWTKTYGGPGIEAAYELLATPDNGAILVGKTSSWGAGADDMWLLRVSSSGDTLWTNTYGGSSVDWGFVISPTSDGGYIIAGTTYTSSTRYFDLWLIRFAPDLTAVSSSENMVPEKFYLGQNYPNPFNPETVIQFSLPESEQVSLEVFDLRGKLVHSLVNGSLGPGEHAIRFDAAGLPSGIYLYRLKVGQFKQTRKMILLK